MAGVARDIERQEKRKFENMYVLEQQIELANKLREAEKKESEEKKAFSERLNKLKQLEKQDIDQQNM